MVTIWSCTERVTNFIISHYCFGLESSNLVMHTCKKWCWIWCCYFWKKLAWLLYICTSGYCCGVAVIDAFCRPLYVGPSRRVSGAGVHLSAHLLQRWERKDCHENIRALRRRSGHVAAVRGGTLSEEPVKSLVSNIAINAIATTQLLSRSIQYHSVLYLVVSFFQSLALPKSQVDRLAAWLFVIRGVRLHFQSLRKPSLVISDFNWNLTVLFIFFLFVVICCKFS